MAHKLSLLSYATVKPEEARREGEKRPFTFDWADDNAASDHLGRFQASRTCIPCGLVMYAQRCLHTYRSAVAAL